MNNLLKSSTEKERKLADKVHMITCGWNHTDQCAYGYRSWEEPKETYDDRKEALNNAKKLLKISDYDTLMKIIRFIHYGEEL